MGGGDGVTGNGAPFPAAHLFPSPHPATHVIPPLTIGGGGIPFSTGHNLSETADDGGEVRPGGGFPRRP